jgi:hypothetical protein
LGVQRPSNGTLTGKDALSSDMPKPILPRFSIGGLALLVLAACGSDGTTGAVTPPPPPPAPTVFTGRIIDDPVQGLHYGTTTNPANYPQDFSRVTGPNGEYTYGPGDFVVFKLGNLNIGNLSLATGIFTPSAASANQTQLQDILILLQSLDQDGNPYNGIQIPAAAADAFRDPANPFTSVTYWSMPPATFASSANTWLVKAQQLGGITTGIVSPAQASANFLRQFLQLFAIQFWGSSDGSTAILARVDTTGRYIMAQVQPAGQGGMPGVEAGRVSSAGFDSFGWVWGTPTLLVDTNGEWGFSNQLPCERIRIVGDSIKGIDCAGAVDGTTSKMDNDPAGIVGAWALGSATNVQVLTFAFFKNGKFAVMDPTGSTATPSCGGPGVEFGSYTYDAAAKILKVSNLLYDTDGCAGLSGTAAATAAGMTFTLGSGGATATYNDGTARTLYRVSQ